MAWERFGYWWCARCKEKVHPTEVTYEETHDRRKGGCGEAVEWRVPDERSE